jgi:hypothetical protein
LPKGVGEREARRELVAAGAVCRVHEARQAEDTAAPTGGGPPAEETVGEACRKHVGVTDVAENRKHYERQEKTDYISRNIL